MRRTTRPARVRWFDCTSTLCSCVCLFPRNMALHAVTLLRREVPPLPTREGAPPPRASWADGIPVVPGAMHAPCIWPHWLCPCYPECVHTYLDSRSGAARASLQASQSTLNSDLLDPLHTVRRRNPSPSLLPTPTACSCLDTYARLGTSSRLSGCARYLSSTTGCQLRSGSAVASDARSVAPGHRHGQILSLAWADLCVRPWQSAQSRIVFVLNERKSDWTAAFDAMPDDLFWCSAMQLPILDIYHELYHAWHMNHSLGG